MSIREMVMMTSIGGGGGFLNPQTKRYYICTFSPPAQQSILKRGEWVYSEEYNFWLHYIYDNMSKTGYKRPEIMKWAPIPITKTRY